MFLCGRSSDTKKISAGYLKNSFKFLAFLVEEKFIILKLKKSLGDEILFNPKKFFYEPMIVNHYLSRETVS